MRPPPLYVDGRYAMSKKVSNEVIPSLLKKIRRNRGLGPIADVFDEFDRRCPVATNNVTHYDCFWMNEDRGLAINPGFEGVHPSNRGNEAMAYVVAKAIKAAIRERAA